MFQRQNRDNRSTIEADTLSISTWLRILLTTWFLLSISATGRAGDWPQILGPQRNGRAAGEKLADNWSSQAPTRSWTMDVGEGYAGPIVVEGRLLIFHRQDSVERLDCVSAKDGQPVWSIDWKATYRGGIDSDTGPRCVPLVAEKHVYVLGAGGDLHCARLKDGKKIWSRPLGEEFKAQDGYFGFGSGPLVIDGMVMVNIGGKAKEAGIVGLDAMTGETKWTKLRDAGSYAAPIPWSISSRKASAANSDVGDRHAKSNAIFLTRLNVIGLRPSDGEILFQLPFGATGPTVNAATPVLVGNRLFLTASYRIGAKCFSLSNLDSATSKPVLLWKSDDVLSSQYPTPVPHNEFLFGVHGREDGAPASLRCINMTSGKVQWKKDRVGMAHVIIADDKLLVMTVSGELLLAELSTTEFKELGRVQLSTGTTRALPALSDGQFFVRDTNGKLMAWKLP